MNSERNDMVSLESLNLTDEQKESVSKLIQSAEDKVRTDYSKKLKEANDEILKYKPQEKTDAEKALEERIANLEAKEAEISKREKDLALQSKLKSRGLPTELGQYLNIGAENEEETLNTIAGFFLNESAKPNEHAGNRGITKKEFKTMDYNQRMRLYKENPTLYATLNK